MKANQRRASALALSLSLALVASCAERRVEPTPTPSPTPTPTPVAVPTPQVDWQEAEITPGDWRWGLVGGKSVASFSDGLFEMRCDRPGGTVSILRRGTASGPVPMTVVTQHSVRTLTASDSGGAIAVALPAHDPLLDAMAFSRGRFAIEVSGLPTIYVPSWPEVSRVIEDCR